MKIAEMIKQGLEQKGLKRLQDASQAIGISVELLRVTLRGGHVPKDKTLSKIADRLGLDKSLLIMAAHREKVPIEMKGFFLLPVLRQVRQKKRVWPVTEEQCDHLSTIMGAEEIQMIRKYRQVPAEVQAQIVSYVDHLFAKQQAGIAAPSADKGRSYAKPANHRGKAPGKPFSAYAINTVPGMQIHTENEDMDRDR
jgi:transcriptional regulator with XRE-family HTH domain